MGVAVGLVVVGAAMTVGTETTVGAATMVGTATTAGEFGRRGGSGGVGVMGVVVGRGISMFVVGLEVEFSTLLAAATPIEQSQRSCLEDTELFVVRHSTSSSFLTCIFGMAIRIAGNGYCHSYIIIKLLIVSLNSKFLSS